MLAIQIDRSLMAMSEAIYLKVEDVDLVSRIARVSGKFGKVRVRLLTKSAAEALRAYLEDRQTGFVFQRDMPIQKGCVAKRGNYWVGLWVDYGEPGPQYPRKAHVLGRIELARYESAKQRLDTLLQGATLVRPKINRPLSKMAVQDMLKHVGERAGLRNVGPHMLRRSFATHLRDAGQVLKPFRHSWGTPTCRRRQGIRG